MQHEGGLKSRQLNIVTRRHLVSDSCADVTTLRHVRNSSRHTKQVRTCILESVVRHVLAVRVVTIVALDALEMTRSEVGG
jgi:hypothetical protein